MCNLIEIKCSNLHGKGVFAKEKLVKGTKLISDVLLIPKSETQNTSLNKYLYPWDKDNSSICIGFGTYLNHSNNPNIKVSSIDKINLIKTFVVINDIEMGDELTIKYSYSNFT